MICTATRSATIRPAGREDITQMAALHARVWGTSGSPLEDSLASLERHFQQVYFESPWSDVRIPCLVCEEADGKITGLLAAASRLMNFKGQSITMAVSSELTVDSTSRARLAGVQLLREFLAGPQDLSLADGANLKSRRIWEMLGGSTSPLCSLNWFRPLRPCTSFIASMKERRRVKPFAAAVSLCGHLLDAVAVRMPGQPFHQQAPPHDAAPLTPQLFQQHLPDFTQLDDLRPEYDAESADWLWYRLDRMWQQGEVHKVAVLGKGEEVLGWYIYHIPPDGFAKVAHIAAADHAYADVLQHLFHHAWNQGAHGLTGRLHPRQMQTFSDHHCLFHRRGRNMLFHSRDEKLLRTFERGDVFLSHLEGEAALSHHVQDVPDSETVIPR